MTSTDSRAIFLQFIAQRGSGAPKIVYMMKHFFRILCVITVLCYSASGLAGSTYTVNYGLSMWLGDSHTLIAPERYNYSNGYCFHKCYVWEYDATYFSIEYMPSSHLLEDSQGENVVKVTVLQPFQGTKSVTCCAYSLAYPVAPSSTNASNLVKYTYNITCNPVNVILYPTETTMDVGES